MKKAKRAISILMCAAMLIGLLPAVAMAEEFTPGISVNAHDVSVTPTNLNAGETDELGWTPYTFGNTSATLDFDTTNQNYHGIKVRIHAEEDTGDWDSIPWSYQKLADGSYTITDTTKFYEIEVIGWEPPVYDNEFVVGYEQSEDFTVQLKGETVDAWEAVKTFTQSDFPLTFTTSATPYKVVVRSNGSDEIVLQSTETNSYTYNPTTNVNAGFELIVYRTEEEYEFDTIPCDWDTQFIAEYQVWFDGCEPESGCTVTHQVVGMDNPVQAASYDGRTRLVLAKETTTVKLTIAAAEGYVYEVGANRQDVTESVTENVYTWAVGENSDVRPEIVFRSENDDQPQGLGENEYVLRYSNAGSVTDIASETVTRFIENQTITWNMTYPNNVTALYRVEINELVENGHYFEYRDGDTDHNSERITVNNTDKTLSFTPNSKSPFEVIIWWTQREFYDSFGFIENEEVQLVYRVLGNGDVNFTFNENDRGHASYRAEDGYVWHKQNLTIGTGSIQVTIVPRDGFVLDKVELGGSTITVTDNLYTWTSGDFTKELKVEFRDSNNSGGTDPGENNPGGGNTPRPEDYTGAAAYIEGWDLAYYGTKDEIITLMATELWNEGFSNYNGHTGDYTGMFNSFEAFENAITLTGDGTTTNGSAILDLSYYTYTVMLHDAEEPEQDIVATGKVYVLEKAKQFGVKIGDSEYHLLDTSDLSGENVDLYVQSSSKNISKIKVFGNGVCAVGSLDFGSGNGWATHITQEHSGLDAAHEVKQDESPDIERDGKYYKFDYAVGGIGCRLAVLPADYTGVKIASDVTAAAWGFAEVPIFATGSNSSPVAEIFYGNDGSVGRTVTISQIKDSANDPIGPAITDIAVDVTQVNPNVATITNKDGAFTVAFNSGYDVIPLNVTYTDGNSTSIGKLTIHRVGLHLESNHVNDGSYQISHGTDKFVSYSTANAQQVVTAAFYYMGADKPSKSEHISLFVTIQTTTGTIRKVVTRLNSDSIATTGNDKWADDFLLWSGTDAEYANLISISAIAYSEKEDGSFGGVKVGSGTGVTWVKSDDAQ